MHVGVSVPLSSYLSTVSNSPSPAFFYEGKVRDTFANLYRDSLPRESPLRVDVLRDEGQTFKSRISVSVAAAALL